jgi:hypothetical protein
MSCLIILFIAELYMVYCLNAWGLKQSKIAMGKVESSNKTLIKLIKKKK